MDRKERPKYEKYRDFSSSHSSQRVLDFLNLKKDFEKLKEKYKATDEEIFNILEDDIKIPTSIFVKELGALESICKYLKENLEFSNKRISEIIGRNSKSVWQAYNKSLQKFPKKFETILPDYLIPISILTNERFSVLESIVVFLKEDTGLTFHEIAMKLMRDDRTIWTVYDRVRRKNDR